MQRLTIAESTCLGSYEGYKTPQAFFWSFKPALVDEARYLAQTKAKSHRGVLVGSCAALLLQEFDEIVLLGDVNNSPNKGDPKDCAELGICRAADWYAAHFGECHIIGMCVAAPTDPDVIESITGRVTRTLRPCLNPCLETLRANPAMSDDSIMVTTGIVPGSPEEIVRFSKLWDMHKDIPRPLSSAELLAQQALDGFRVGAAALELAAV